MTLKCVQKEYLYIRNEDDRTVLHKYLKKKKNNVICICICIYVIFISFSYISVFLFKQKQEKLNLLISQQESKIETHQQPLANSKPEVDMGTCNQWHYQATTNLLTLHGLTISRHFIIFNFVT